MHTCIGLRVYGIYLVLSICVYIYNVQGAFENWLSYMCDCLVCSPRFARSFARVRVLVLARALALWLSAPIPLWLLLFKQIGLSAQPPPLTSLVLHTGRERVMGHRPRKSVNANRRARSPREGGGERGDGGGEENLMARKSLAWVARGEAGPGAGGGGGPQSAVVPPPCLVMPLLCLVLYLVLCLVLWQTLPDALSRALSRALPLLLCQHCLRRSPANPCALNLFHIPTPYPYAHIPVYPPRPPSDNPIRTFSPCLCGRA